MTLTTQEMETRIDATVENHGTIFLVRPETSTAREWLDENTDGEWFGGALVVEHSFVLDLVQGMLDDGLEVE